MCGIIGYIGAREATPILLGGLKKLEYRGYDSAGVALVNDGQILLRRTEGKIVNLENSLSDEPISGVVGIGHTRWATHGRPSEINAHPHMSGNVVLVHNGIIENHNALRAELEEIGHTFSSETDSEIVAHLIDQQISEGKEPVKAVLDAIKKIEGAYALCVAFADREDTLVCTKKSSPLVLGYGDGENFTASDIPAILEHTTKVDFLMDGEVAQITTSGIQVWDENGQQVSREPKTITWDPISAEKGGHKHFMHKEIFEQPRAIINTLDGRVLMHEGDVFFDNFKMEEEDALKIERAYVTACGTAWHAGLLAKRYLEDFAKIPTEVDYASEFRYRKPLANENTLCLVISQSGETADTLAALREAKSLGSRTVAICNVFESTIAREADDVVYTHAGPEIGVASTKAFVTQVAVAYLLAVYLGRRRNVMDELTAHERLAALTRVPLLMRKILESENQIRKAAKMFRNMKGYLFLGRGPNYPIALEGALKLKEISYLHAEGYAAGEMKHGPIALVDENMLTVGIAPKDATYEKMCSNIEEIVAREGKVLMISSDWEHEPNGREMLPIPDADPLIYPLLTVLPLQLFSYHIADLKGNDVDQPRNLAKSVTVE